jgi:hypothetical protein
MASSAAVLLYEVLRNTLASARGWTMIDGLSVVLLMRPPPMSLAPPPTASSIQAGTRSASRGRMSGPTSVSARSGSPTFKAATRAAVCRPHVQFVGRDARACPPSAQPASGESRSSGGVSAKPVALLGERAGLIGRVLDPASTSEVARSGRQRNSGAGKRNQPPTLSLHCPNNTRAPTRPAIVIVSLPVCRLTTALHANFSAVP